jgi:hypothetical protein
MMMNCHYIKDQLERLQQAGVGAGHRLAGVGSIELEEDLQAIELAISRIRDEMRRQERRPLARHAQDGSGAHASDCLAG